MISNKARVEASICSSYRMEEISTLAAQYSERQVTSTSKRKRLEKNDTGTSKCDLEQFSVFNYLGRGFGKFATRWLNDQIEKHAIETYVLLNCDETEECAKTFSTEIGGEKDTDFDNKFTHWFKTHVKHKHMDDELLQILAVGPSAIVKVYPAYFINGYTFHTLQRGEGKSTMNSGVCITSLNSEGKESQYYGLLEEIIELKYTGVPPKHIVLFKCRWFHPKGMKVHEKYDLVEINHKMLYRSNDPFIFASQAVQVYYAPYPGAKRNRVDYWAVCKTKARKTIDKGWSDAQDVAYQHDDVVRDPIVVDEEELIIGSLRYPSGDIIIVRDDDDDDIVVDDELVLNEIGVQDAHTDEDGGESSSASETEYVYEEEDPSER